MISCGDIEVCVMAICGGGGGGVHHHQRRRRGGRRVERGAPRTRGGGGWCGTAAAGAAAASPASHAHATAAADWPSSAELVSAGQSEAALVAGRTIHEARDSRDIRVVP
jgi:hypothetical protein